MAEQNLIQCSECGHEHFDTRSNSYTECPLAGEGCTCPMNDESTTYLCANCEERYDSDETPSYFSEIAGVVFCDTCWYEQFNEASNAWLVEEGEATKYLVTEHGVFDAEYLESVQNLLTRTWHRTDGWRGYYETLPNGEWREVTSGWTTGNWGDSISDGKQAFNRWVEGVVQGEVVLDHPVWIITDLTSNVFSTAVGVFVPKDIEDEALDIPALP